MLKYRGYRDGSHQPCWFGQWYFQLSLFFIDMFPVLTQFHFYSPIPYLRDHLKFIQVKGHLVCWLSLIWWTREQMHLMYVFIGLFVICGFWRKLKTLLPLDSITISVSFFSFRFLKEELTDCSIPGLELLTVHKQILTGMLTWLLLGEKSKSSLLLALTIHI